LQDAIEHFMVRIEGSHGAFNRAFFDPENPAS